MEPATLFVANPARQLHCLRKIHPDFLRRMGVRAEARLDRLVILCEGHSEPGMRGGYVWCTARENREAMREYLLGFA